MKVIPFTMPAESGCRHSLRRVVLVHRALIQIFEERAPRVSGTEGQRRTMEGKYAPNSRLRNWPLVHVPGLPKWDHVAKEIGH
jgi:hypothetical protein